MSDFLLTFDFGMLVVLALVAGLFFLRFWKSSGDRFFAFFAVAFFALGANWALLTGRNPNEEYLPYFYLLRLGAFLLILVAIVDKNRRSADSE